MNSIYIVLDGTQFEKIVFIMIKKIQRLSD
jgi:hypothetical protein